MLCNASASRLPRAAAATRRTAAAWPLRAQSIAPSRFLLVRAQKETTPSQDAGSQQQQQEAHGESAAGGAQLQPRVSQGGELSTMPFASDLMDLRTMMPTPFRRMADHMLQMQREMDSLMGAFGMPSSLLAADPWDIFDRAAAPLVARRAGALSRVVPLEVSEDDKSYTVTAEVPGFDKNEIKVSLSEDGVLTMMGSHEEMTGGGTQQQQAAAKEGEGAAAGAKQEAPIRSDSRRYSSFFRSVQLPDDADTEGITATTQHGVLTVRIPKSAKQAPKLREIPVA